MDKYITCKTVEQWEEVLKKLGKEGYKWLSGDKATSSNGISQFNFYKSESVIHASSKNKRLSYSPESYYRTVFCVSEFISATEFLADKTKSILISRKGRVVTAENKNTGEKAIATCSPTDEFDFGTGAMIALSRLIATSGKGITKDAETAMRELLGDNSSSSTETVTTAEFHVGDLVTLKKGIKSGETYGSLELLNGIMYDGAYGKPLKVTRGRSAHGTYLCEPVDGGIDFYYSEEMLESWKGERSIADEIHEGDTVRITDTGKQYTTYNEWIKNNITDVDLICEFDYNRDASRDIEYVVVKIAEHGMHNRTLAYIREKADLWPRCYLIDVKGLEKVTK